MRGATIAVPCYNAGRFIEKTLEAISTQSYPMKEVLVVDDGSTDNTVELASKYKVKIIKHSTNQGLAAARNTAANACRTEFIAFLDADCIAEPKWLETLMAEFTGPEIAAAGGSMKEKNTKTAPDMWRAVHMRQDHGDSKIPNAGTLAGSNVVFRVSAIKKAGLFDVRFRTNYEDCDMSNRLRVLGFSLAYQPSAVAWHMRTDTLSSVMDTYWRWCYSYKKNTGSFTTFARTVLSSFYLGPKLLIEDLMRGRIRLCLLDALLPFYHLKISWRRYAAVAKIGKQESSPPQPANNGD